MKISDGYSGVRIWIPTKLPSLNDYVRACRTNRYAGSQMKRDVENEIAFYLAGVPRFRRPVTIEFHWHEKTRRRDLDNIAFGKKFVLDALVKCGKLLNDDRKHVTAFSDSFEYGDQGVLLVIKEDRDAGEKTGRDPDAGYKEGSEREY